MDYLQQSVTFSKSLVYASKVNVYVKELVSGRMMSSRVNVQDPDGQNAQPCCQYIPVSKNQGIVSTQYEQKYWDT